MENYTKNKLQKAANSIGGVHPDWDPLTSFRWGFKEGAKWLSENMWISVEEFGYPHYDKKCEIDKRERYLLRFVSGSISQTVSYKVGYLAREDRFVGEMDWVSVTHWMPIPEIEKGE